MRSELNDNFREKTLERSKQLIKHNLRKSQQHDEYDQAMHRFEQMQQYEQTKPQNPNVRVFDMNSKNTDSELLFKDPKEYYKRLAEEYRQKFMALESEHIYVLQNQKNQAKNAMDETEVAFTNQYKRLEFVNKKQLEQFEKHLDEKDILIQTFQRETDNLKIEVKHMKLEISNICSKHVALQKDKDVLQVKVKGLEIGQSDEVIQLKANYARDLEFIQNENKTLIDSQDARHQDYL